MTQKRRALEILMIARELPEAEIEQFLDQECAQDAGLREKVEKLLSVRNQAQNLLPDKTPSLPTHDSDRFDQQKSPDGMSGTCIGPYKLLQPLGEGGFGVVYMAAQTEPVRREVALKIIKPGMDTREVIARFESERQALALMDHPNIARVLDAGQTEDSRPYFVMELVKGVPITDFCDKQNLDTTERLKLFVTVCHAVQHAHQKGIIHRDLKTSNVMVALDGTPIAKVIDFGVSKAITQRLTEKTLFTQQGQMIGTPQYMSPEQAEMSGLDVDTRSDIYSLGVLLYELLTGTTPLDAERLRTAGFSEMQRIIQEEDPPTPSTRLSTLGNKLTIVCQHRQTDARRLHRTIRGDLDWIVMKALEKRRDRRYETANGLAADIQRHLANETIAARPPSTTYKIQKAWRRNKVAFTAAAVVIAALAIGLVASLWSLVEANHQRGIAQTNFAEAQEAWRIADEAREKAETARKFAEDETARADVKAEELRRRLYIYHVSRAVAALEKNRDTIISEMLEACPEDLRGWEWRRLSRLTDRSELTLRGHTDEVQAAAFSPDGKFIVSGSSDQTLKLWDAVTGQELRTMRGHGDAVHAVVFSPDGKHVVSSSADQTLKLWDAATGQALRTMSDHTASIRAVSFNRNGTKIASGSEDHTVKLWDVASGRVLKTMSGHTDKVTSVALAPDGNQIVSASTDGTFILWDAITGRPLQTIEGVERRASDVAISPNGTRIVSRVPGQWPKLWDAISGNELRAFQHAEARLEKAERVRAPESAVAFSPDGRRIVTNSDGAAIWVWDVETDEGLVLFGHKNLVLSLGFNHDGTRIVSGSADHTVKLWDANLRSDTLTLRHDSGQMRAVAFNPNGRQVASAGFDGMVRIWDPESGQQLHNLRGHHSWILAAAYSPDGRFLVSGSADNTLRLWDANTGQHLRTLRGHTDMVNHVAFSPNGKRIGSAGYDDDSVRIWDVATGTELLTLTGHGGHVEGVAFSPQGKYIASCATFENSVKLWHTDTGEHLRTFRLGDASPSHHLRWVTFSPDGTHIAVTNVDRVRVLLVETGEEVLTLEGHAAGVTSVVYSPDGQRLFSSSLDGTVKVWHAQTGEELLSRRGTTNGLWCVAISTDGGTIGLATDDSSVKLWETSARGLYESRRIVDIACRIVDERFENLIASEKVVASIRDDQTLDESVRRVAARIAAVRGDNAYLLNREAWAVVKDPNRNGTAYARALHKARVAAATDPEAARCLGVLGVALYRTREYGDALQTLSRSDRAMLAMSGNSHAANLAFNAMIHDQLGRREEAQVALDRLRTFMKDPPRPPFSSQRDDWSRYVASPMFLSEAEALISGD